MALRVRIARYPEIGLESYGAVTSLNVSRKAIRS
jgi:hypothetical protein